MEIFKICTKSDDVNLAIEHLIKNYMKENLIQKKSYFFALEIIRLYRLLVERNKEFVISKQLLKCGTSIGANIEEAIGAQSKNDFIAK